MMHLSSVIPAKDTGESVLKHQNFPCPERGSNLGPLAPEALASGARGPRILTLFSESLTKCNLIYMYEWWTANKKNSSSVIDLVLCSAGLVQYTRECSTLSHEKVRSDHIAIFFEADFDLTESSPSINNGVKIYILLHHRMHMKNKWIWKWQETTENQFEDSEAHSSGNSEEDYARFCELMQGTLDTVIPQKTVKIRQHATRPFWWNEEVKEAKTEMNSCRKKYK